MAGILVTNENFKECVEKIAEEVFLGFDTETTGLQPYLGHRLFSVIFATKEDEYYFSFNEGRDHLGSPVPEEYRLGREKLAVIYSEILSNPNRTLFIQNAKFDMHMFYVEHFEIKCVCYCTLAMGRLINNRLPNYKLETLGALIGYPKDSAVEDYITKHRLYTDVEVGKKKPRRDKHYNLVPFDIIAPYGLRDGRVVYQLGMYERVRILELSEEQVALGLPPLSNVENNELELTRCLFEMEKDGIKLDRDYCEKAYYFECDSYAEAAAKFEAYTGVALEDSAKCYKKVWTKLGLTPGKTATGRDSYSAENLPDSPVTDLIKTYRYHYKRAHTYFKNYLDLMDEDDVLHCNFRQSGTATGRMSSNDPNLQNVPKRGEDTSDFPIRRCFVPREGYFLAMIDFDQMEYRLLLDLANEEAVIKQILEEGLDVHTATGKEMGVERDPAKTLNFMLLYGGGAAKLATALGILLAAAKKLKLLYFRKLSRVSGLIKQIESVVKKRGFIVNWLGRRILGDHNSAYKIPNHYIQGGCGDICKIAMNRINQLLKSNKYHSKILLQVHDELILEVKIGEEFLLEKFLGIMENSYPYKYLPLTAGIETSKKSWFDKKPWKV